LSEHGIYTKERRIDIFNNEWIQDNRNALQRDPTEISYFRDLWIRFFETLGRFCYDASGRIVSLYEGVRQRQISDGALPEKISVVPNGIDVARFAPLRSTRPAKPPLVLALLGRVVPIKDVKTYIRAIRILVSHIPELEGWVVGPDGEDPEYAAECRALAQSLEIADRVRFTGFMNPVELFPRSACWYFLPSRRVAAGGPGRICGRRAAGLHRCRFLSSAGGRSGRRGPGAGGGRWHCADQQPSGPCRGLP